MDPIADLRARGLLHQSTAELEEHLRTPRRVYCGFDPTADSLHIGSLVPLLTLRRLQQAGHTPIMLVGGSTGLIGDPSFKATERSLNTTDTVRAWVGHLRAQLAQFVDFEVADNPAIMANNYDWTAGVSVLDFLRDVGKHFSVNDMIRKESVKARLERPDQGISFTEFSYLLLQSFDFAMLARDHDCTVQLGGSDQWGNIIGGVDLCRRMLQRQVHGLTLPLITKSDGTKFGKTETGTIWLSSKKTSPYAFYQFWLGTSDADVYRFLGYYSDRSMEDIAVIQAEDAARNAKPEAQRLLAEDVTLLVHGQDGLGAAQRITQALFSGDLDTLSAEDYAQLALDGLPCTDVDAAAPLALIDVLVESGLATSRRNAREFVDNGAVMHNGERITSTDAQLSLEQARHQRFHLLKRGKKQFHLLRRA